MTIPRLFWTEVAVNWFDPAKRMGGSHSRNYDYLHGLGATDIELGSLLSWPKQMATDDDFASFACRFENKTTNFAVDNAGVANLTAGPADSPLQIKLGLANSKVLDIGGASPFAVGRIISVNEQDPWTEVIAAALAWQ